MIDSTLSAGSGGSSGKSSKSSSIPTTVENKHNEQLRQIQEHGKQLPLKKTRLTQYQREYDELSQLTTNQMKDIQIERRLELRELMAELQKEIRHLEQNDKLNNYLMDTSHMLFMYFDEGGDNYLSRTSAPKKRVSQGPTLGSKKTVLDFFKKTASTTPSPPAEVESSSISVPETTLLPTTTVLLNQELLTLSKQYKSKGEIMDTYLSIIDKNHIRTFVDTPHDELDNCKSCGEQRIFSSIHSVMICPKCGFEEKLLIDSETPSYKEPPREITYFAYKKINHFNEWLSQFQAKESTDIPEEIFERIQSELKKERYLNTKTLKASKVRDILKKLNLTKYYEHCPYITNRITGKPAPEINDELQEKLRNMFRQIQGPWNRHCPPGRSNFFSYPYIFYKFLQLLSHDEFLPYFRLLKSREKLQEHDEVWKKICGDLKWEFIKTV